MIWWRDKSYSLIKILDKHSQGRKVGWNFPDINICNTMDEISCDIHTDCSGGCRTVSIRDTVFSRTWSCVLKYLRYLVFNYWVLLSLIMSFFLENKWYMVTAEDMVLTYAMSIFNFMFHSFSPTQRGKHAVHTRHVGLGKSISRHLGIW